ncbi:MAG: TIGR02266 family protein [Deltaproteobacteria bacterium]|nr:TIGR02266 family protein [Deltaproteobacteria bacterium]
MAGPKSSPRPVVITDRGEPPPDSRRRREYVRYHVELGVTLDSAHNFYGGSTLNLSAGGLFVATPIVQPVGTRFDVAIHLRTSRRPIKGTGEVRWLRAVAQGEDSPAGMGIRFLDIEPGGQAAIAAFLESRPPLPEQE